MRPSFRSVGLALCALALTACAGGRSGSEAGPSAQTVVSSGAIHSADVTVGTSVANYNWNSPNVPVRVCLPGDDTQCIDLKHVTIDTGSVGLRIFSSALKGLPLPLQTIGTNGEALAECYFAWGPVKRADVTIGGLTAADMEMQVFDQSFRTRPEVGCSNGMGSETSDSEGLLGVNAQLNDCWDLSCTAGYHQYFQCTDSQCVGVPKMPQSLELPNPVAAMPSDNNGLVLSFPTVGLKGAYGATGTLVLGLGTNPSNTPSETAQAVPLDPFGNFTLNYAGETYSSGFDTGTNFLNAPLPGVKTCGSSDPDSGGGDYVCTPSLLTFNLRVPIENPPLSAYLTINIQDYNTLGNTGNLVFPDLGGISKGAHHLMLFGFPFFLGNTVYVGFPGTSLPVGAGPFVGFEPSSTITVP